MLSLCMTCLALVRIFCRMPNGCWTSKWFWCLIVTRVRKTVWIKYQLGSLYRVNWSGMYDSKAVSQPWSLNFTVIQHSANYPCWSRIEPCQWVVSLDQKLALPLISSAKCINGHWQHTGGGVGGNPVMKLAAQRGETILKCNMQRK